MKPLIIDSTEYTPSVTFDAETGRLSIKGFSLPENIEGFYKPVLKWINSLKDENDIDSITIDFNLQYYNSGSVKAFIDILNAFLKLQKSGKKISVNWSFDKDDFVSRESASEISEVVGIPFNYIPV